MARKARSDIKRPVAPDALAALSALPPVIVPDREGEVSLRALRDAVERLPAVAAAREWAFGDGWRRLAVSVAVGRLNRRSFAASVDAAGRAGVPC